MGSASIGSRRDDQNLLRTKLNDFLDQPGHARGPITQPMRFAAPVPFRGERGLVPVGRQRQRQRAGDCVGQMIPANAGEIDHFGTPRIRRLTRRSANQVAAPRFADEGEHESKYCE